MTWVFNRDGTISERNIRQVGAENYFYGGKTPEEPNADPAITDFEGEAAAWITAWRRHQHCTEVSPEEASRLVAHLTTRSKALREGFFSSAVILVDELISGLRKEATFQRLDNQVRLMVEETVASLISRAPGITRQSHNQVLARSPAPELRVESYRTLRWVVETFPQGTLVLGDAASVVRPAGGGPCKVFSDSPDGDKEVFLPLASSHLLAGRRATAQADAAADPEEINGASVRCSLRHFVSSRRSPREEGYQTLIGQWAEVFPQADIIAIAQQALAERSRDYGR